MENYDKNETLTRKTTLKSQNDHAESNVTVLQNSVLEKLRSMLSKWAGVIALLISIAVGTFTVVDQTLIAPNERRSDDLKKLSEIIVEFGRANVTSLMYMNVPVGLAVSQSMNSVKLPLLASAVNIIEKHPDHVDAASLIVLAGELIQAQDYELSLKYATMARDRDAVQDLRIEAARLIAISDMGILDVSRNNKARRLFEDTISDAKRVRNVNGPWLVSNAIRDWAIREIFLGNCEEASEVLMRFTTDVPLSVGRAAAQTGFTSVINTAQFSQICSKEALEVRADLDDLTDKLKMPYISPF